MLEAVGEESAGGDQPPVLAAHPHQPAAPATCGNAEPELVILGERIAGKGPSFVVRRREPFKRAARRRAAHPCARQPRPQPVAHHQRLAMGLGEFLAVMAAELVGEPAAMALHQGLDRQLDEIRPVRDRLVQQAERGGIDNVLGIVEHHHCKPPA